MEQNIFEHIFSLIKQAPPHAQFLLIGVFFLFYKFYNSKEFRTEILSFSFKKRTDKINKPKALQHELFFSQKFLTLHLQRVNFEDKHKQWLFDTILKIKIEKALEFTTDFIKTFELPKNSRFLQYLFESLIYKIIEAYEIEILNAYRKKYGEVLGNKIYNYVYVKIFKPYHSKNVEMLVRSCENISLSDSSINQKINTYFTILQVALQIAVFDCERVFKDMNGTIAKMIEQHKLLQNEINI